MDVVFAGFQLLFIDDGESEAVVQAVNLRQIGAPWFMQEWFVQAPLIIPAQQRVVDFLSQAHLPHQIGSGIEFFDD